MKLLDKEIEQVRQLANGYPANPISAADVWMAGAGYSDLARALAGHFKRAGWLQREGNACSLWAKATLSVNSHYHHLVGPAMLADADCQERLGNLVRAATLYTCVVKDFIFLAGGRFDETATPTEEDKISLRCLSTAVNRLLAQGENQVDNHELVEVQSKIESLLART